MPFLRFSGFEKNFLQEISPVLIQKFAEIASVPEEKVKIERLMIEQIANSPSSVEILMFQRNQEKHDAIAAMIDRLLKNHGYSNVHIFFVILEPSLYYKEGVPLEVNFGTKTKDRVVLNGI